MTSRQDQLARRRERLVQEIGDERERLARTLDRLRQQAALAGLGVLATRLLGRSRWFRWLAAATAAAAVAFPLASRLWAARR